VSRRDDLAPLAVVLLLILLFFADVLFFGKTFYIRDLARIYYPERKVLRDVLRGGEFPFWNPHYGPGQPLAANPTSEVFYPPQWLVLLPDFQTGVAVEVVFHFLLGATGMFLLLRSLRLQRAACAFGLPRQDDRTSGTEILGRSSHQRAITSSQGMPLRKSRRIASREILATSEGLEELVMKTRRQGSIRDQFFEREPVRPKLAHGQDNAFRNRG